MPLSVSWADASGFDALGGFWFDVVRDPRGALLIRLPNI
jgi:hypothetical protein